MQARTRPRIKICCMQDTQELWQAVDAGASAVGLVSAMPSGAGIIDDDRCAAIAQATPTGVDSFLLTSLCDAPAIIAQHRHVRSTAIQVVDHVDDDDLHHLREELPGVRLIQVIHVVGESSISEATHVAPLVDALLLDSGNPTAAVKELGGTGRCHDWSISCCIREAVEVPVWLAGGLHPGNVAEAVESVGPYGLDVCSRLRPNGRLDEGLLEAFVAAVR